jgi:hypothetical protein
VAINFSRIATAAFSRFGEDVIFTPTAGAAVTLTGVVDKPLETVSLGHLGAQEYTLTLHVRLAQVVDPRAGAWTVRGTGYVCDHAELDALGEVWTAYLR